MSPEMVTRFGSPFPRRNCVDLWCPTEKAISQARNALERAVEKAAVRTLLRGQR